MSSTSMSFICEFDLKMTLEEFSLKRPNVLRKFVNCLNEKQLCRLLLDAAIEKRILRQDSATKVNSSQNGPLTLMNEFKRKCCTVELLCECIKGRGLTELFGILGVFEKIFVISQTDSCVSAISGQDVVLSFLVEGYPNPNFKWYYNGVLLPDATEPTLTISNFRIEMEGRYYCIAEQQSSNFPKETIISKTIECIMLISEAVIIEDLPPELTCPENEKITFQIKANNDFTGVYEWFHGNRIIYRSNSNYFTIRYVKPDLRGPYRCVLINSAGETHSSICNLKVVSPLLKPSGKLALLFGSCNYSNFSNLKTPAEDVHLLADRLNQLGFTVQTFIDTSKKEADRILLTLSNIPKKSFVFFYVSGHGFELCNNKFFIPVDCPPSGSYTLDDCLHYQYIIKEIMQTKPLLLISVLDMCLRGPDKDSNPQLYRESLEHHGYDKSSHSHLVEACATSDYQLAFERTSQNNGLYCTCLCEYIMDDSPIDDIFKKAHEDFVRKDNGRQSPQFKSSIGVKYQYFRLNMGSRCR